MSTEKEIGDIRTDEDFSEVVLSAEDIRAGYGKSEIIRDVDLVVQPKEIACIIGPNGAGKSTLLYGIVGSRAVDLFDGTIRISGTDITNIQTHETIEYGISYMPQGKTVFPYMDVDEHLNMGGWTVDGETIVEQKEEVLNLFPQLRKVRSQNARTMSGGEQQMLTLARTLMVDPDLLVLDEPSLGLAPQLVDLMLEKIKEIRDYGTSILMVEQDAVRALKTADRGYVLDQGTIRFEGDGDTLLEHKEVQNLYLGMG